MKRCLECFSINVEPGFLFCNHCRNVALAAPMPAKTPQEQKQSERDEWKASRWPEGAEL